MLNPIKLRHEGFLAILLLLIGKSSIVTANTNPSKIMTLASRGPSSLAMAKSKSSALSAVVATTSTPEMVALTTTRDGSIDDVLMNTFPRGGGGGGGGEGGLKDRLKVGSYFAIWYILNIIYNILNKKYLNIIPAPLSVGSLQFLVGALYSILLWVTKLRPSPILTNQGKSAVSKVGFYHMSGQELSMISLGAGPVSFTHIVKALEPFFSAVVSAVVFGKWMHPVVYTTLIPVVGGVAYACLKERSFSLLAFWTAMGSNVAFALRAVVSKSALDSAGGELGKNLSSVNLFGVVTIYAFLQSIPVALFFEGWRFVELWNKALSSSSSTVFDLISGLVISGLFHYLNNEVMYLALSNVHPVTLAVGNTMKRVFIVVASVLVFRNPISVQAAVGSVVGIGGVLLYSLTKQYYEALEKKRLEAAASLPPPSKPRNRLEQLVANILARLRVAS